MAGVGFTGPPAVDFYSMLSGLGDTIAKNRADQAKRDAFAAATTPGADGKIDYGKAMLGLAQADPQAAALFAAAQNHQDTLAHQTVEDKRNATNDAFNHNYQNSTLALQRQAGARAQSEFDSTPDQYAPNPKAGQPGEPQYIDQYAQAKAAAESNGGKPVPFETLSGTKFMVRQPDGSYGVVNPGAIGAAPQPGAPQPQIPAPVISAPPGQPGTVPQQPVVPPNAGPPVTAPAAPAGPAGPPVVPPAGITPGAPPTAPVTPQADLTAVDPTTGRREGWLKAQDPDVQAYVKKVADYEVDPRTTSVKGGMREKLMSAVAQYDPTYDQNTFGSRSKAIKDFGTGPLGNSVRSFDVAIDHMDTLKRYVKALDSGDVRVINSLRNSWLSETGSPLPTNVQAIAPIVGAEVSKAIIGSNNALADREELRKPLALANSPAQVMGAIDGYQALMGGQLKGLKKQYEDTTGKKNFDTRIRENTKNVLFGKGDQEGGSSTAPNMTSTGIKWSVQ